MGAVVKIWLESLIPFLQRDSHIVHWSAAAACVFIVFTRDCPYSTAVNGRVSQFFSYSFKDPVGYNILWENSWNWSKFSNREAWGNVSVSKSVCLSPFLVNITHQGDIQIQIQIQSIRNYYHVRPASMPLAYICRKLQNINTNTYSGQICHTQKNYKK